MNMMKPREIIQKFEDSNRREQILIGLTGAVAVVFLLHMTVLEPIMGETEKIQRKVVSLSNAQISLQKKLTSEPKEKRELAQRKQELQVQEQKISLLDDQLETMSSLLVSPDVMPGLLQSLISQSNMKLIAFENLPSRPLLEPEVSEEMAVNNASGTVSRVDKPLQIFRHELLLQLRGSYGDSLQYLQNVESKPWRFIWNSLDYEVEDYPNGKLTIKLETLSAKQQWLGV